ncbi:ABC transporter permease [Pseudonocardia sp. K10HN5]|uniref:ABC transporter permease n=1 Tax=Pseudonocardia acidicola TaxID=2724939 RepID=A0ABX1SFK9_9PSEU|nr:ABC transporter permease [Pseudonocardia acidicola]
MAAAGRGPLTGTGTLVRLALRRDHVLLPAWITVFVVSAAGAAAATAALYPTVESRVAAALAINGTPSLLAIYGPVFDPASLGALALWKLGAWGAAMVAVLTMLTVVRHTRTEEEAGRLELLAAGAVGRHAVLAAALLVGVGAAVVLGLITAVALMAVGLPVAGSLAFGLAWAAAGIAFAAVGAVTAQLARSARGANGLSAAALGLAFAVRAVGDAAGARGPSWLSWVSPIGWSQQVRPFAGDRWWVFAASSAAGVLLAGLAFRLAGHRDLDAGLLPDRTGPARGAPGLRSPFALAWRLQRGGLIAWASGLLLLGALLGNVATGAGGMLDSPQAQDLIMRLGGRQALSDAFLAAELSLIGMLAAVYMVQATRHLYTEECTGRAESVLATGVGRIRWAAGHLSCAALGSAVLLALAGLGAGVAYGIAVGDARQVAALVGGALAQLPAAWVLGGLVVALFGFAPRRVGAGWAALTAFLLIAEIGPLLRVPQWVLDLSPFTHLPRLPGGTWSVTPLLVLLAVAAGSTALGLLGLRRRDAGAA